METIEAISVVSDTMNQSTEAMTNMFTLPKIIHLGIKIHLKDKVMIINQKIK